MGKSTILNAILSHHLAIVSEKPETTRDNILGILNKNGVQAIFIDTPGIHKPRFLLGKNMVMRAKSSLFDADLVLFVADVTGGFRDDDYRIVELLKESKKPAILAINKIDLRSKSAVLPIIDEIRSLYDFLEIIPISALAKDDIDLLVDKIIANLSEGDHYYPDSQLTDKSESFRAAELIREKALSLTRDEVPHAIAVMIDKFQKRPGKSLYDIEATIYVERDSQKGIIVGRKGAMAKEIGTHSRKEIEQMLGKKVFLRIWVKVLKNWRKDIRALKQLGMA